MQVLDIQADLMSQANNFVQRGSAEATEKAVSLYYCTPSGSEPRDVGKGTLRASESTAHEDV